MALPHFATPVRLGALTLRNRIVMAPMTRSRAGDDGIPTASMTEYYLQRAGAGAIITEGTNISTIGKGNTRTPGIWTRAQQDGWKAVTDAVHRAGGTIVLQLWHTGRLSHSLVSGNTPVAPSAIPAPGEKRWGETFIPFETPHALSAAEIASTIEDYARAARNALSAGFDGVEIHGANGYLPDQFLHASSNTRTDDYGGSPGNRCRFLLEVVEAVSDEVGGERTGLRLSPSSEFGGVTDPDPEGLYSTLLNQLDPHRLAFLHIVEPGVAGAVDDPSNIDLGATWVRKKWTGALISTGGHSAESGHALLAAGHADAIGFGRAYIGTPDLAERLIQGRAPDWAPRECYYRSGDEGYIDFLSDRARELVSHAAHGRISRAALLESAATPTGWEERLALRLLAQE